MLHCRNYVMLNFEKFSEALLPDPDSLMGRGYGAPLQTLPASVFQRMHLPYLEIKLTFECTA